MMMMIMIAGSHFTEDWHSRIDDVHDPEGGGADEYQDLDDDEVAEDEDDVGMKPNSALN